MKFKKIRIVISPQTEPHPHPVIVITKQPIRMVQI